MLSAMSGLKKMTMILRAREGNTRNAKRRVNPFVENRDSFEKSFTFMKEILSTPAGKLFNHQIFELNQKIFSGKVFFFEIKLFGIKGVLMMRG